MKTKKTLANKAFVPFRGYSFSYNCRRIMAGKVRHLVNRSGRYDGLLPTEMWRLKQLEDENGKLRKLVADLSLDKEMLQDVIRRKL